MVFAVEQVSPIPLRMPAVISSPQNRVLTRDPLNN